MDSRRRKFNYARCSKLAVLFRNCKQNGYLKNVSIFHRHISFWILFWILTSQLIVIDFSSSILREILERSWIVDRLHPHSSAASASPRSREQLPNDGSYAVYRAADPRSGRPFRSAPFFLIARRQVSVYVIRIAVGKRKEKIKRLNEGRRPDNVTRNSHPRARTRYREEEA